MFKLGNAISIAVIAVEPVIIYSFVKKAKALVNTIQNDPFASFLCQTAENYNGS